MIRLVVFFLIFTVSRVGAQELSTVRSLYPEASENAGNADRLYNMLTDVSRNQPVLTAYKGAALTLKAKFAKKIKEKVDDFKAGSELIDAMVLENPDDIEIRYIRLTVQENSPKIVKYKRNIEEDKAFILAHFKAVSSQEVAHTIKAYVLRSKVFSPSEKQLF